MRISPNLRSLSLPANLCGLADDIHALEERLLESDETSVASPVPTVSAPLSFSESDNPESSTTAGIVLRPRRRRRQVRRRLLKRSMSMAVMNHAGEAVLFDDDDDANEFVWLVSTAGEQGDFVDDEEDYGTEDDDSFTHYMLSRQTPNNSLYSREKVVPTVGATSTTSATTVKSQTERGERNEPQSYLPSFVGEEGDDAYGDDNSIGFMSLPDIEEEEEREEPAGDSSGATTAAWKQTPAQLPPLGDVHTAIAILNDLSRVLGHEPPSTITVPSPLQEEDASETLPTSPNTVIGWYPGGAKASSPLKEQAGDTQSERLPTRSASLSAARMLEAARAHSKGNEKRQFTLLQPGDRTQSMPARLIPPLPTAKPKKSALKRTSSICRSSQASMTEDSSVASSGGDGSSSIATLTMNRNLQPSSRVSSTNSLKRNVSFTKLDIREYSIALSDHPGCSYGPPVQLGWDYQDRESLNLEEYEQKRPPRRSVSELVMSYNVRRYLLLKRAGYSKAEIQEAMKEVERVKRDRMVTDLLLPAAKIDETLEEVILSFKEILFPPPKKRPSKAQPELSHAP